MPGLLTRAERHGAHRLHLFRARDERREPHRPAGRETRAVTELVAIATAVLGALWVSAAVGLADTSWWWLLVIAASLGFLGLALAAIAGRHR